MDSKDDLVLSQKMTQYRVKRWPSAKTNPRNARLNSKTQPTYKKFLLTVVAHLGNLNLSFLLASSNLGDEISFKGGSL
jgi:hypothetical protein